MKRVIIAFTLFFMLICHAEAKIFLVSVGISDYPGTANDLRLPANDAKVIQYIYQKNAVSNNVLLVNSDASKANVLFYLRTVFAKAAEDDIIVFFFSGHGTKGAFCGYDDNISYTEIRQAMASSKARNKMIFADACFSGKMRQGRRVNAEQAFKDYNILLFLSSRPDETSIERRDMKNGFFTSYLQKGLRGGADANRDRIITARELFNYVSIGVKNISNDKQHPVMWGKFSDNMPVMKW